MSISPHILHSSFLYPPLIFNGINDFSGRHLEGQCVKSQSTRCYILKAYEEKKSQMLLLCL